MAPRNWWPDRSSNKLTTWERSVAASDEHGWILRLLTDGFIPNYKCPHLHEISCIGRWLATGNWKRRCYLLTYLLTERRVPSICLVDWQSCWLTEMLHQNRIKSWCSAWISLPGIFAPINTSGEASSSDRGLTARDRSSGVRNVFSSKPSFKILSSPNILNVSVLVELRNPTAVPLLNGGVEANTKPTTRPEVQTDSELNSSLPTVAS